MRPGVITETRIVREHQHRWLLFGIRGSAPWGVKRTVYSDQCGEKSESGRVKRIYICYIYCWFWDTLLVCLHIYCWFCNDYVGFSTCTVGFEVTMLVFRHVLLVFIYSVDFGLNCTSEVPTKNILDLYIYSIYSTTRGVITESFLQSPHLRLFHSHIGPINCLLCSILFSDWLNRIDSF